jgi:hypothetical protein
MDDSPSLEEALAILWLYVMFTPLNGPIETLYQKGNQENNAVHITSASAF